MKLLALIVLTLSMTLPAAAQERYFQGSMADEAARFSGRDTQLEAQQADRFDGSSLEYDLRRHAARDKSTITNRNDFQPRDEAHDPAGETGNRDR